MSEVSLASGNSDCSLHLPAPPARTDGAKADTAQTIDAKAGVMLAQSDGLDMDSVERERQSRLARWQRQAH